MQSIIHDGRTAVTSATEAEDRVPSDAEYEHAFRLIRRIEFAAESRLNCLRVVEAYICVGLGHLVPKFLRAVEENRRFAEGASDQDDPAFVLQHTTGGRLKIVWLTNGKTIGDEYSDADRGAAFKRRDLLNASYRAAVAS